MRTLTSTAANSSRGHKAGLYPKTVEEVVAIEPEPHLRRLAERAAATAPVPVTVVAGRAEALPFGHASFDVAVVSRALCSTEDPALALAEIRRLLKPGGELRFWEHVGAQPGRLRRLQRLLDHVWPRLSGGCHLTRDTEAAIADAGFQIAHCRRFSFRPNLFALPISPQVIGIAKKSTDTEAATPTQT